MALLDRLIATVAPHCCFVCGLEGSLLCTACVARHCAPAVSTCFGCQQPTTGFQICVQCQSLPFSRVWVYTDYQLVASQLIKCFKFDRAQSAAGLIAGLMVSQLPCLPPDTLVIPIPTATSRRRQRGYDHAALLARQVAYRTALTYCPALARFGQSRQVGATKATRQSQLQTVFWIRAPSRLQGTSVLLVDDVATTGASLTAAASSLLEAGAISVDAVVFAHKK